MEITLDYACDQIARFANEGRLIEGQWHSNRDGRELACIYGSISPNINSSYDCPTALGPRWLIKLVMYVFDGLPAGTHNDYGLRFAQALRKTSGWTSENWQTLQVNMLCSIIDRAGNLLLSMASTTDIQRMIENFCQMAKQVLQGNEDVSIITHDAEYVAKEIRVTSGGIAPKHRLLDAAACAVDAIAYATTRDIQTSAHKIVATVDIISNKDRAQNPRAVRDVTRAAMFDDLINLLNSQ
jgi:hypothetical protein